MKKTKFLSTIAFFVAASAALISCGGTSSSTKPTNGSNSYETQAQEAPAASGVSGLSGATVSSYLDLPYVSDDSNTVTKATVTAELEDYVLDNFLGGIPYADNSAYIAVSNRISGLPSKEVPGYGYGLNYYGSLTGPLEKEENAAYKMYFHRATTKIPTVLNIWNSQDSNTDDIVSGYLASSYYTQKPKADKSGYTWVGQLADALPEAVDASGKPVDLSAQGTNGLSAYWKIKLKKDVKYNTSSATYKSFNGRAVQLEDYLTPVITTLLGSNGQYRAGDLADPTAGGLVGASKFTSLTSGLDQVNDWDQIVKLFKENVGFSVSEENGDWYVTVHYLVPVDQFNAMYNITSSIYSPVPEDFFKALRQHASNKSATAVSLFGQDADSYLGVGPYSIQEWQSEKLLALKKNAAYLDSTSYKMQGIHIQEMKDTNVMWAAWKDGRIDYVGVSSTNLGEAQKSYASNLKLSSGDTVWKLQVNSTTPEQWEKLFGANGSISAHAGTIDWNSTAENKAVQQGFIPANRKLMSNYDFLNGVYYAINRVALAKSEGRQPSNVFLPGAYMSDPVNGVSYRDTAAGKAVADKRKGTDGYGFDLNKAVEYFKKAQESIASSFKDGVTFKLSTIWQTLTQIEEEGKPLEQYIVDAWNKALAQSGKKLTLEFNNIATAEWMDAYYYPMRGEVDFAFGSISGSAMTPLNFMNTVSTTNSSGFTLSWGTDTTKVGGVNGALKDPKTGKDISYDALFDAATNGTVLKTDGTAAELFAQGDPSKFWSTDNGANFSVAFNVSIVTGIENFTSEDLTSENVSVLVGDGENAGKPIEGASVTVTKGEVKDNNQFYTVVVTFPGNVDTTLLDVEFSYTATIGIVPFFGTADVYVPFAK